MMLVGLAGILVGDSVIFKAGKDYGDALLETRLGKHIPQARIERVRALFARHGSKLIMAARFLPGLRAVTYFVAGTSKVPYLVFILYDGLAALISAPAWVWLGYWMGQKHAIKRAYAMAKEFQLAIFCIMAVMAVAFGIWWLLARRREAARRALRLLPVPEADGDDAARAETPELAKLRSIAGAARPGVERA
jgi:membrane protein DedA with SNARE-associated domain